MATRHRIYYRVVDENGLSITGIADGEEDVRDLIEAMRKRFRDAQLYHFTLMESYEERELTDEERQILLGLELD